MEARPLTEIQIQATAWRDAWREFPEYRRCFFHVPNESTYNNGQQASSGVIAGIQDMFLLAGGRCYPMELKDDQGRVSDAQKVVHAIHKRQGFDTFLFRDAADIINFIRDIADGILTYEGLAWKWSGYISPFSIAEKYEEYLAALQAKKKKRY